MVPPHPRPDGGCQKVDTTFTKGAVDGQFSDTGEKALRPRRARGQAVGWGGPRRGRGQAVGA